MNLHTANGLTDARLGSSRFSGARLGSSRLGGAPIRGARFGSVTISRPTRCAFTLLELVIAVALLASFVLPILHILADSRLRATRYTQLRTVKSLTQKKLYDHIHYVEGALDFEGTFEAEGYPRWTWHIDEPTLRSQGETVVLEYTIRVKVPLQLTEGGSDAGGSSSDGSEFEYSVWTLPSRAWNDEQYELYASGQPSLLYGDPAYGGTGTLGAGVPGGGVPGGGMGF